LLANISIVTHVFLGHLSENYKEKVAVFEFVSEYPLRQQNYQARKRTQKTQL